jgi:hypothetical protein
MGIGGHKIRIYRPWGLVDIKLKFTDSVFGGHKIRIYRPWGLVEIKLEFADHGDRWT